MAENKQGGSVASAALAANVARPFMLLSLMDDPNRIAVQGKVVWITPEGVQGNRTQGIGVQFTQDETGAAARAVIEKILGETLASSRPTHTM